MENKDNTTILIEYLDSIKDIESSTNELTYRTALDKLFKDFAPENFDISHEPKQGNYALGRPDFLVKKMR